MSDMDCLNVDQTIGSDVLRVANGPNTRILLKGLGRRKELFLWDMFSASRKDALHSPERPHTIR